MKASDKQQPQQQQQQTVSLHCPEFILCGDNEISSPIPPPILMDWPPVTWAEFPQETPDLRAPLFLWKLADNDDSATEMQLGNRSFRWVGRWQKSSAPCGKIVTLQRISELWILFRYNSAFLFWGRRAAPPLIDEVSPPVTSLQVVLPRSHESGLLTRHQARWRFAGRPCFLRPS